LYFVFGVWCLVLGAWCLVLGALFVAPAPASCSCLLPPVSEHSNHPFQKQSTNSKLQVLVNLWILAISRTGGTVVVSILCKRSIM
jgi:heme/copper-type cytochrome/quinol oxidase subunit 1